MRLPQRRRRNFRLEQPRAVWVRLEAFILPRLLSRSRQLFVMPHIESKAVPIPRRFSGGSPRSIRASRRAEIRTPRILSFPLDCF